jgi:hypothetical protein
MANQFYTNATVTDTDIADAMLNDTELFACVFHEFSEQIGSGPFAKIIDVEEMSPAARTFVRTLAAEIDRVEAKP